MKILHKIRDFRIVALGVGSSLYYELQRKIGKYYYSYGRVFKSETAAFKYALLVVDGKIKEKPKKKKSA